MAYSKLCREDSRLTDEDVEYLEANCDDWDAVEEDNEYGIIIHNYQLPTRYMPHQADLMIIIPADYPVGAIDMFYCSPSISRKDGQAIGALGKEDHFGKDWQRWSRHYKWVPGEHSLVSHISFIRNVLDNENPSA